MFEGYLELGGGEVLNSARAKGYATTAPCPVNWLQCPPCDGIRDFLGDDAYTYELISEAPWYDKEDEVTHRFLGAHAISVEGLPDSTREASVAENMLDGGVVGRVRHGTRRTRYRALLTAQGEDALEAGFSWLSSALTPGSCGTHGDGCGAADAQFFTACPPERADVTMPEVFWNDPVTNLATNPSLEHDGPAVTVRTNLATNPSFEAVQGTVEVRRNYALNPSVEADLSNWGMTNGTTSTMNRVAVASPQGSYCIQYLPATSSVGDSGPSPSHNLGTVQPGQKITVSVYVYQTAVVGGGLRVGIYGSALGADGTQRGAATTVTGQWVRIFHTVTATVAGDINVFIGNVNGGTAAGAQFWVDGALIEKSGILGDYFDGATPQTGDFWFAFVGAANASASVQYANAVRAVGPYEAIVYGASSWKASGSRSLAIRAVGRNQDSIADLQLGSAMNEGGTFTLMGKMRLAAALTSPHVDWFGRLRINSSAAIQTTIVSRPTNTPGVHDYREIVTLQPGSVLATFLYNGSATEGETVWWDDFAVVKGAYLGPYFDGRTPPKVRRNLVKSPSFEAGASWWGFGGRTPATVVTVADAVVGSKVAHLVRNATTPGDGYFTQSFGDVPVGAYTLSYYIRRTAGNPVWRSVVGYADGGMVTGDMNLPIAFPADQSWVRVVHHLNVTIQGTVLFIPNDDGDPAPAVGNTVEVDAALFERGATLLPYFDGETPVPPLAAAWDGTAYTTPSYLYDPDFTYAWTGVADQSPSVQQGILPVGTDRADVLAAAVQSSRWSEDRSKSIRIHPVNVYGNGNSTDTFVEIGNMLPSFGDKGGRTYTLRAVLHLEAPLADANLPGNWGKFRININTPAGGVEPVVTYTSLPTNVAGDHLVSGHFTVPANVLGGANFIRLMNGSAFQDVWWDDIMLVEGEYGGPYFDGALPDSTPEDLETVGKKVVKYDWTGTPDASTSTYTTGSVVAVPDPEEYARILNTLTRYLHTVTCVSGPIVEQKLHRGDTWGYIVEFVLVAAVPWMFSVTRPVILQPTIPIVVQDVPFNLVPYPSAELESGTVVAATNFATNPSVEAAITGWTGSGSMAGVVVTQSNELASVGAQSAKALLTATTTSASLGQMWLQQDVALPGITATTRYSVNLWAVASVESGTAVLGTIEYHAIWLNAASAVLRDDLIGSNPASGGAKSGKSLLPPAGTTKMIVRALLNVASWSTGAKVRLYADAAAVTVP
jgi:hypothetical protein